MERAGLAAAREILACVGDLMRAVVLVGSGNNGGDGYVIARHLFDVGWQVEIVQATGDAPRSVEAKRMATIAGRLGIPVRGPGDVTPPGSGVLVVDAILGTATRGAPRDGVAAAIAWANAAQGPVVSVDIPSGVDPDTGRVEGSAITADLTVTLHADKVGLRVMPGRQRAGRVVVVDVGIPRAIQLPAEAWLLGPAVMAALPARGANLDKYAAGAALVVAGSPGMMGAAALATRAAMRAGAGLVVAAVPDLLAGTLTSLVMEAIAAGTPGPVLSLAGRDEIMRQAARVRACAIGPGIGRAPETGQLVEGLLSALDLPMVVDADALWHLDCDRISARPGSTIITPHSGEAARLLGCGRAEVDANRLMSARTLAERAGAVCVLKGYGTIIAAPGGPVAIDSVGGPELATAGSGDVLTGTILAMLARGLEPFQAASVGVVAHGLAGQRASRGPGTVAGDIAEALPEAMVL